MFEWFGFWRRWRRRRLLRSPVTQEWQQRLESLSFWQHLDAEEQQRLSDTARILVAEKSWEGCGGLELTAAIRQTIAATAALMVIHQRRRDYRNVASILVYPGAFVDPSAQQGAFGVVSEGRVNHGSAWLRGPVILDWNAARQGVANDADGRNLLVHEFAHKLDMLDGFVDGKPPLAGRRIRAHRWREVMLREYEALCRASDERRATLLDKYGTVNPAEFFAVATEVFLERGSQLRAKHPALYQLLADYFGLDPAAWRQDS